MILTPKDGEPVRYGCLHIDLPPLSVNNLFANGKKGRFATTFYKDWQTRALTQLRRQGGWHVAGRVRIKLQFSRTETSADLDNLAKPVLDILVKAGRIDDDRNVCELRMIFKDSVSGTQVEIWRNDMQIDSAPKNPKLPVAT